MPAHLIHYIACLLLCSFVFIVLCIVCMRYVVCVVDLYINPECVWTLRVDVFRNDKVMKVDSCLV